MLSSHGRRVVVSLWSPSGAAATRAQEALRAFFPGWRAVVDAPPEEQTEAAQALPKWDSVAMECPTSGTVLQWLFLPGSSNHRTFRSNSRTTPCCLVAVQEASSGADARKALLATSLQVANHHTRTRIQRALGRPVTAQDLLGKHALPVLQWTDDDASRQAAAGDPSVPMPTGTLKEVAIPTYDQATYDGDGTTLRQRLAASPLGRPATGLYQFTNGHTCDNVVHNNNNGGVCVRPLPTSDRVLAPPTLVFHHDGDLEDYWAHLREQQQQQQQPHEETALHKIGYNGTGAGQIMLRSAAWAGLDVRVCAQRQCRASFCEAQEALLGGSLPSLQSHHVLAGAQGSLDPKTNRMDCWVEFRATLRNPLGYFRNNRGPRVAKAPDLPFQ
jgi:hypothetical protein